LEVPVHALVAAVVLGLAGARELDGDALLDPPHAQPREPAYAQRGEWRAVVHPDDLGQPVPPHRLPELAQRAGVLLVGPRLAGEHVAGMQVANGERIAARPVSQLEPALVVG